MVGVDALGLVDPAVGAVADPQDDSGQQRGGQRAGQHGNLDVFVALAAGLNSPMAHVPYRGGAPSLAALAGNEINLTVAGTKAAINMVEAGAKEVSEEQMLKALAAGHEAIKELCAIEEEVIAACAKEKMEVVLYEINPIVKDYIDANGAGHDLSWGQ